jgi:hypothetical protein
MSLTKKEKIKTVFKLLIEPKVFFSLVSFRSFGYLVETGWFESFKSGEPLDVDLKPIPWFTYSAIEFISNRLSKILNVFEFGSGNSTLYLAERVNKVTAIEHNENWFQSILSKKKSNVEIKLVSSETVSSYLQPLSEDGKFDIIIIDGLFRNECIKVSVGHLSKGGIIILDDSERNDYAEGITFLVKNGFQQLNFSGIAPGIFFRKCTTVFYNDINCVNI